MRKLLAETLAARGAPPELFDRFDLTFASV
jgi:hypothetical protein